MEFVDCQKKMTFEFDMDHISDDWVVLMTLLGNDYVPGLPNFNVDHNVLTMIYDAYKTVLTTSNGVYRLFFNEDIAKIVSVLKIVHIKFFAGHLGYINEYGLLNVRRFARLIHNLKEHDFNLYRNIQKNAIGTITEKVYAFSFNNNNNVDGTKSPVHSEPRYSDFMEIKDQYYTAKLGDTKMPNLEQMSASYVKMIQWTLFYYYRGACSWNEFYPFDCAPYVSDFVDVHKTTFQLEFNKPVDVYTHLLAILPKRSAHLLPKCYQLEMFDDPEIPVSACACN